MLTDLLDPHIKDILHVAVQHHPTVRLPRSTGENNTYTQKAQIVYLVIVEEKKAGFVDMQAWKTVLNQQWSKSQNSQAHLDQLVGYGNLTSCTYSFLTDYFSGVAIGTEEKVARGRKTTNVAAYPHGLPAKTQQQQSAQNPIDLSLRHAVCLLGMKAMYDLGVLDLGKATGLAHVPRAPSVQELLRAHKREQNHQAEEDARLAARMAGTRELPNRERK
ncbi:hypothetical protein JCM10449v2_002929 [Rhodotorula kratochvilovae]